MVPLQLPAGAHSRRKAAMAFAVSSGALRFGQWPVARSSAYEAFGMVSRTYSPTAVGAMASLLHCRTRVGTETLARSARLSDRNVARANRRAISGSVRQK